MNSISIRLIENRDRPALLDLLQSSRDFPQHLLQYHRPGGSHYRALGVWSAGELVGVLTGSFDSDFRESLAFDSFDPPPAPHAYLDRIHVHENARGQGFGQELVHAYASLAADRGCTFIGGQIDLSSDSTLRRRFFENLGFIIRTYDNFGARPQDVQPRTRRRRGAETRE